MTTLCPVCKESVGSAHKCPYCSKNIHVFCGRGIGNEGYGQKIICPDCDSKATGAALGLGLGLDSNPRLRFENTQGAHTTREGAYISGIA